MKNILRAAAAVILLSISAHAGAAADDIAKGQALAERLCATCHLGPGQGEKTAPSEIPGFYAIARRPNQTQQSIIEWLRSVPPMMPNHHLSQDEIIDLSAYILSLRDRPPA